MLCPMFSALLLLLCRIVSTVDPPGPTAADYENFAKYLLAANKNFTADSEPASCVDIDPRKELVWSFPAENNAVRLCDVCPQWAHINKFTNIFLDVDFFHREDFSGAPPEELLKLCLASCLQRTGCIGLSLDHTEGSCFLFNTTGRLQTEPGWTTLVLRQPMGLLRDWIYFRHSALSSVNPRSIHQIDAPSPLACIHECRSSASCVSASYEFRTLQCILHSEMEDIVFDYVYGSMAFFPLNTLLDPSDHSWRFIIPEPAEKARPEFPPLSRRNLDAASPVRSSQNCAPPLDQTEGNFFNRACLTADVLGCDQSIASCQRCYYPELSATRSDLPICQNSEYYTAPRSQAAQNRCFESCLSLETCIGVDIKLADQSCALLRAEERIPQEDGTVTRYHLLRPTASSVLYSFSWLPNTSLVEWTGYFQTRLNTSLAQCLEACKEDHSCREVTFTNRQPTECHLAGESYALQITSDDVGQTTFFKLPSFNSVEFFYIRWPGWKISGVPLPSYPISHGASGCLQACMTMTDCAYVYVNFAMNGCTLYSADDVTFEADVLGEVYIRSLQELTLESVSRMRVFDEDDLSKCFARSTKQTFSDLANGVNLAAPEVVNVEEPEVDINVEEPAVDINVEEPAVDINVEEPAIVPVGQYSHVRRLRRVKRFFNFIKAAVNAVKDYVLEPIVAAVVEPIKDGIKTAEGLVNAVGKIAQGDFEGALEEVTKIPIVADVIQHGQGLIAVIEGEKSLSSFATDLLESKVLDLGLNVLTGGLGGVALKAAKKIGTKVVKKVVKKIRKKLKKIGKKIRGKKKRPAKDRRKKCRRGRRGLAKIGAGAKKKCKKTVGTCKIPKISNSEAIKKGCAQKQPKGTCNFECLPGYQPTPTSEKLTCTEYKTGKSPRWNNNGGACTETDCEDKYKPVFAVRAAVGAHYLVKFNKDDRLPVWSITGIHSLHKVKIVPRRESFYQFPCKFLKGHQARGADYLFSGYDKGHLSPANLFRYSLQAAKSANFYINAAPQDPYTNQGPWKKLEYHVECLLTNHPGVVVTGVCPGTTKLKPNGLKIPSCFWKLVCYESKFITHAVAFIAGNSIVKTPSQRHTRRGEVLTAEPLAKLLAVQPFLVTDMVSDLPKIAAQDPRVIALLSNCVNPNILTLDPGEKKKWQDTLDQPGGNRRKRSTRELRGCSAKEFEKMAKNDGLSLLAIDLLFGNETEDSDVEFEFDAESDVEDGTESVASSGCGKRVIGYYPSYGQSFFSAHHAQRLTHVVYAFLELKSDGVVAIGSADPDSADAEKDADVSLQRLNQLLEVANRFPHLKVMFATGGWRNSHHFSLVARTPELRLKFIGSILELIDTFGFAGVDVNWEHPVTGGAQEGIADDKANYVLLMQELRSTLDEYQQQQGREDPFIITFAGAASQRVLDPGYDLPGLLKYADWVNVMTYDYFGTWGSKLGATTGSPAPLYFSTPPSLPSKSNVDATMKYYVCRTLRPDQIILAAPFYGRLWHNVGEKVDPNFDAWRRAEAKDGKFEGGFPTWREIAETYLSDPAFSHQFDNVSKSPYAWNPTQGLYLGYENTLSLEHKVAYAKEKNLGGMMVWDIDHDDANYTMLEVISSGDLCGDDPRGVKYTCSPLKEKRWWTHDEDEKRDGMCGRSSPLYDGYYPLCDPDDPWRSCCSVYGYCGSGPDFCSCPGCVDYGTNPDRLLDEPVKPTMRPPYLFYFNDAHPDLVGRCGRNVRRIHGHLPVCNPDDTTAHCCSSSGYCGATPYHCDCDDCIDFAVTRDAPQDLWWPYTHPVNGGKCGPFAPLIKGQMPICDPDSSGYCCSDSGFCGNSPDHCLCRSCVNFKAYPNMTFGGKQIRWWTWWIPHNGFNGGLCGTRAPVLYGKFPICNPDSEASYCCSSFGFCGNSPAHCLCQGCVNFKANPNFEY